MSTNSIIAIAYGDGWRGRYCHSDGYPSWNGRVIWNDVKEAGAEAFEDFLTGPGRSGVSVIYPGFLTNPAQQGWDSHEGMGDTFNYRVYYGREGEPDDTPWVTPVDTGDLQEYLYVVGPAALVVYDTCGEKPQPLGLFRYADAEPDWENLA